MNKLKEELELLSKPGETILETLEHMKMSQVELAERMGKTPSKINDLISAKEPITMNTALQLEKVLGIDAQFWLNREINYREKLSRLEQEEALEQAVDWLKNQPISELKKCGYIKTSHIGTAMVDECLRFYGVAATTQWETVYINNYFTTDFRKSNAHTSTLGSLAAWLRMGEIEARKLSLPPYDKEKFKNGLNQIKSLVRNHPEDFADQLRDICFEAGVAVVYTMCISHAPISGATRWIGGNPLIQLCDRYKTNDHFWFTFFHESAHVLLHGKKDIFIEELKDYPSNEIKEREANELAIKMLLPNDIIHSLPGTITEKAIRLIARENNTHPAIVLGHLQHLGLVKHSFGYDLKLKVILDSVICKNPD